MLVVPLSISYFFSFLLFFLKGTPKRPRLHGRRMNIQKCPSSFASYLTHRPKTLRRRLPRWKNRYCMLIPDGADQKPTPKREHMKTKEDQHRKTQCRPSLTPTASRPNEGAVVGGWAERFYREYGTKFLSKAGKRSRRILP